MAIEIISWSIPMKVWDLDWIDLATSGSAYLRFVTDCATQPSTCAMYIMIKVGLIFD